MRKFNRELCSTGMNKKANIFFIALIFMRVASYAQKIVPPEPQIRASDAPPVGLPLPIDDYIPFFIVFALIVGVVFVYNKERSKILTP